MTSQPATHLVPPPADWPQRAGVSLSLGLPQSSLGSSVGSGRFGSKSDDVSGLGEDVRVGAVTKSGRRVMFRINYVLKGHFSV